MKYDKILNDMWRYLESHFKSSEITIELMLKTLEKMCDNNYCLKKCIKIMWEDWLWYEEREYFKKYVKENYNMRVV